MPAWIDRNRVHSFFALYNVKRKCDHAGFGLTENRQLFREGEMEKGDI